MKQTLLILLLIIILSPYLVYAVDKNPLTFANPDQESRYQNLTTELRCVVCQNQSVADSNAELAQDVRDLVRNRIIAGQSDEQITDFLVERYGDFVLYNPPVKTKTYLLWLGPALLLLIGLIGLGYFIRRHVQNTATPPSLTTTEQQKIKQLLGK
jgi:cytochrome c-type biogenesis protein CcmH